MTKRRKKQCIQSASKAELMLSLAILKQEKELAGAQGKWVWIKHDRMMGQLMPAEPIRQKLEAQIKTKRQLLELLRTGKVSQP
jgi:hypothetical protein